MNKQKKHRLTKENMERPALKKMEQPGNELYPVANDNY